MEKDQTICSRCVSDTTIPEIHFDENGVCQFCKIHDVMEKQYPLNEEGDKKLKEIVELIKHKGKRNKYDCVCGVSGGRDSTYLLYLAVTLGLRPLAVHFDNGWNSEIAVTNIKNAISKLNIDLYTKVVDWEEFKELQISFLKASVSDAEIPTDVGIFGTLHKAASEENIKFILNGHSFRTEGIMPIGWTYMDGKYVKNIQKLFGHNKLKTMPNFTIRDFLYYRFLKGIEVIPLLNYFTYNQKEVGEMLEKEVGWTYYGGHHHESYYTHFFQSYLLPRKFNVDKRKIEYSALIRSGQMTRDDAIKEISENTYPFDEDLVCYTIKKLGMKRKEFDEIFAQQPKSFKDYPTYYSLIKRFKMPIKKLTELNILPDVLYYKFFS